MGRSIYADMVGSTQEENNTWVHKFWVAVQPSDVSDYLDTHEPQFLLAYLDRKHGPGIRTTIEVLQEEFVAMYGMNYRKFMKSDELNELAQPDTELHAKQLLASRINLGEHLLQTIENMKKQNIEEQELTIEC